MSECPRCPAELSSQRALEAHLVEAHLMGAEQAMREARGTGKADRRLGVNRGKAAAPVSAVQNQDVPDHACPRCGAQIPCDWASVASMEQQAHRLKILAGMWKARLGGATIGRPRRNTFDVETARRLVATGMTYQAVAEALGASSPSAVKSALTRARTR